eukprot:s713_g14.t1
MERATSEHSVSTASQMEKQVSQASAASAHSIISEGWRSTGMAAAALMGAGRPVQDVGPQQVRTSSSSGRLPLHRVSDSLERFVDRLPGSQVVNIGWVNLLNRCEEFRSSGCETA